VIAGLDPALELILLSGGRRASVPPPPPPPPAQLAPPSLAAGVPSDTAMVRSVVITVSGPTSWPVGVTVQLQTRRGSAAFANVFSPTASTLTLPFAREASAYTVDVRGFARIDGGSPADSDPSAVITLTIPALVSIPVLSSAAPLVCAVQLFPSTSEAVTATGGGAIPTLIARSDSDHVLRIRSIRNSITAAVVEPTDIRYRVEDATGLLVGATVATPTSADDWQIPLSRALFVTERGTMTLRLTLVAPDTSETVLQFTLAQGVQQ
jgi:hypothetical protein